MLQSELDALRKQLGISAPHEVIYQADLESFGDRSVVVEADGFGGATVCIVEGNYPIDFAIHQSKFFTSEEAACGAAERVSEDRLFEVLVASEE